jgi:hypothetical protein
MSFQKRPQISGSRIMEDHPDKSTQVELHQGIVNAYYRSKQIYDIQSVEQLSSSSIQNRTKISTAQ